MELAEDAFSRQLPAYLRRASRFWTAGVVVEQAVRWLEAEGARSVLDVGSGIGKFCTLGALASDLQFCGVEHREKLVGVASSIAHALGAQKVSFLHAHFSEVTSETFDALYVFNPFQEHLSMRWEQLDRAVELNARRFERDVHAAESMLKAMPVQSLLLTYYQFGGRIPLGYSLVRSARHGGSMLRLWRKETMELGRGFWIEHGEHVLRRSV